MTPLVATVLVDPSTLFREGLRRILSSTRFRLIALAPAFEDLRALSLPKSRPVLLIVGTGEGQAETASIVSRFKQLHASARVVVLGDHCKLQDILPALRAGANGYLVKTVSCEELIKSLELVMLGGTVLPADIVPLIHDHDEDMPSDDMPRLDKPANDSDIDHTPRRLSSRETEILRSLMQGESNKIIARKFEIAEATVKVHIKAILRKIRVRNRTQAAIWAVNNLLQVTDDAPAVIPNGALPTSEFLNAGLATSEALNG